MTTLQTLSNDMVALVETASASIVQVDGRRRLAASGIIMSADGVIVTSNHVVTRDEDINIGLPNGETVSAEIVGRDPSTDLAVLRINADGLTAASWRKMETAAVGQLVLALGRPGKDVQATLGVVSALRQNWRGPGGTHIEQYFQTDVVMYPGFSGGPLVGGDGQFYGLNTSARRGTSLTIPTETLERVTAALLEHGHIKRGYLGVTAQTVRLQATTAEAAGQETGLMVAGVEDASPAAVGGILQGDIMLSIDGNPTRGMDELLGLLNGAVGKTLEVVVARGGEMQTLSVTIGERE